MIDKKEIRTPTIDELPWPDDLPYDDGEPMESPWHYGNATLLLSSYVAARGGRRDDYYIGANMFVYYSAEQARNRDYKGPDVFIVKGVDGTRPRLSWKVWEEAGRYPDVIFELLSSSTEANDLGDKKRIYEHLFRTAEYFCVAAEVERLFGWRLSNYRYVPIKPNERGWLWSEQLELWVGAWQGAFLALEHTWLRFYDAAGNLVLTGEEAAVQRAEAEWQRAEAEWQRAETERQRAEAERQRAEAERQRAEAERQRAETERQRAETAEERIAALEAELRRLRGE